MVRSTSAPNIFILQADDPERLCPVLQARFDVADLQLLRALLGADAEDDPELRKGYFLDNAELAAVTSAFGIRFDIDELKLKDTDIFLCRLHSIKQVPYLVHTGYELPLLLDGRKKLARIGHLYPPMIFNGEDKFDRHVAQDRLYKEEMLEPFEETVKGHMGHRTAYYTLKGEEWRIPAMRLIWEAAGKSGGWNEYFERLEGMLFGYEDWQNDWWIRNLMKRGGIGGAQCCCAVSKDGLAWIESAAFRALPPCDKPALAVTLYDDSKPAEMRAFLNEEADSAALVCFAIPLWPARDFLPPSRDGDRWQVPADQVPELNRFLHNPIVVVMRRDDP